MTETFTVSFREYEYYDIQEDKDAARLCAVTSNGTWSAVVYPTGAGDLRESREAFKAYVLQAMALKQPPTEVHIG